MAEQVSLGILVGGGPAPGINGVIAAVTIEAIKNGFKVYGFKDGFKFLMTGSVEKSAIELTMDSVAHIHTQGGSIIRTSRANPLSSADATNNVLNVFKQLNVKHLVTIGGKDTAYSALTIAKQASIRVAHIPKTIDNDLPLPKSIPAFGFQTAMEMGANIVLQLQEDAKTAGRYFIVTVMGKAAGHLALSIGKAAAAHLTIIPEEFIHTKKQLTFKRICDTIEGCILKRKADGKDHGVVLLAEGLLEHMTAAALADLFGKSNVKYDPHGHLALQELDFGVKVRDELRNRMKARNIGIGFTEKILGDEMRCAPPNAFDREYTRDLGYAAVKYLVKSNDSGAFITIDGATMVPLNFDDMIDPETGKIRVRYVDIESEGFEVAQKYMIKLLPKDFADQVMAEKLAKSANCTVEQLTKQLGYLVK